MNQRDLARALSKKFALSQRESPRLLRFLVDRVRDALARGDRLTLQDFGVLRRVRRAAKTVRHPKTGNLQTIPAHLTISFHPSPALLERLK